MIELSISEFHTVTPLFQGIDHSIAIVHSVLEKLSLGRVFIDNPQQPAVALHIVNEQQYRAVSSRPSALAYRVGKRAGQVVEEALEISLVT